MSHICNGHAVFYSLGIRQEQVLDIASQVGADKILLSIIDNYMGLKYLAFSVSQIIETLRRCGPDSL